MKAGLEGEGLECVPDEWYVEGGGGKRGWRLDWTVGCSARIDGESKGGVEEGVRGVERGCE